MNVLVTGANGFLGRAIVDELSSDNTVFRGTRNHEEGTVFVDLTDPASIEKVLEENEIDAIINAAGIVDTSADVTQNELFTRNLLTAASFSKHALKRIIVTGSAAEYGILPQKMVSVPETEPLRAESGYGLSKADEERAALDLKVRHGLPVVVARVFNPVGKGMKERFLVPRIMEQVKRLHEGDNTITVHRLDAERDYVDVKDVAKAYRAILEGDPSYDVYNVGSGETTTNSQLIDMVVSAYNLSQPPVVAQSSSTPEPNLPPKADISRIRDDLGWAPRSNMKEVVEDIVRADDGKQ